MDERTARPGLVDPGASFEVPYTTSYFNQSLSGCLEAARLILGQVLENYQAGSMLDVGCGIGSWLHTAGELGIKDLVGIDGQYIDLNAVLFDPSVFVPTDLNKPFSLPRRFDLAVSCEVAEHLPHERGPTFVRDIAATSDVVVFSAAIPFQGGDFHFNEQWPEYWAILFRQNGFVCFDPFRDSIWDGADIESWYAQNVFLYVKKGHDLEIKLERYRADRRTLSRVHPNIFLTNVTRNRPLASAVLESEIRDWHRIVEAYVSGAIEIPPLETLKSAELGGGDVARFPISRMRYSDASETERRNREEREYLQKKAALLDIRATATIKQIGWLRQERDSLQNAVAVTSAELDWLRQRLGELFGSTSWQITRPLRAVLGRTPRLARFLRITLRLVWWTVSLQLARRLAERRQQPSALSIDPRPPSIETKVDHLEAQGVFNAGWYGADQLSIGDRFNPVYIPSGPLHQIANEHYEDQTKSIIEKYYVGAPSDIKSPHFIRFGPMETLRTEIDDQLPRSDVPPSADRTTYSVVTTYFEHREFFLLCAVSVAALIDQDFRASGERRIEWIVVNDDSDIDEPSLREMLPASIRDSVRIISELEDGENKGVVAPLNEGIRAASNEWLLFLDCDDRIAANATMVLDHYIRKFRSCRYISSAMIDIDEHDQSVRRRRQQHRPADMMEVGTIAGHLKAIRRDLFDEIGEFNVNYPGSQDFELALRVSLREPILIIPDYLYFYRWHPRSQSVAKIGRQNRTLDIIRKTYFRRLIDQHWPPPRARYSARELKRGICLVRTQGRRLEFLEESLRSIAAQKIPTTPCLLVHADRATFEMLERWVESLGLPLACVVLHAGDLRRFRGYPLNVGIDYIAAHRHMFDFVCMLDDDDIQYPLFSERMAEALRMSGADVVVGLTNHRRPWAPAAAAYPLLPASSLVAGNFIPNNAYAVRVDSLLASGVRFPEDMDYIEDWHFLLSLLLANLRFAQAWETVAEFRMTGDGNTVAKKNPDHYKTCEDRVIAFAKAAARRRGLGIFYREIMEFDFDRREPLRGYEIERLTEAHRIFQDQAAEIDATQPTAIDFAAAVPFRYRPGVPVKRPSLAVICHLFHERQASQFERYLRNINFPFDLHISTDTAAKKTAIEAAFAGWSQGPVEVRIVRNQGRDIAPKLLGFAEVYKEHEYVLHLHSKESLHAPVLAPWRTYILENLLGSKDVVNSVFEAFQRRPDLGMIGPQHIEPIREWVKWSENFEISVRLASRMGITLSHDRIFDFPAGSMFWARSAALKPLLDLGLTIDDFEAERGQTDGTLAHAIERLYYFVCERAGYRWMKVCRPELVEPPARAIDIPGPEALGGFLSEYRLALVDAARSTTHRMLETPSA